MSNNERKISVALEGKMDNLSSTLQKAATETERQTRAMSSSFVSSSLASDRLTGSLVKVGGSASVAGRHVHDISTHAGHARNGMTDLEMQLMNVQMRLMNVAMAVGLVSAPFIGLAALSTNYLGKIETAGLGIGAAFMLGGTYIDQTTGKVLEGLTALNAAQADSASVMEELQYANIQTTATLNELVKAYQETLPVALAKGFNRDQARDFTVSMVQAAGAIGLSFAQMGEETRSLLTQSIDPRTSRIATVLGLRNEDLAPFKNNANELFSFLMEKLDAYKVAGLAAQHTWDGLWSNTKDIALKAGGDAFGPLFEGVKYELEQITTHLVTIDEKTKKITWNQGFLDGIQDVKSGITATIAEVYRFSMLLDKAGGTMTTIGSVMLKSAEVATRFMTVGQFGDTLKGGADSMNAWNKEFERRYQESEKALQALANRELGLDANGSPLKRSSAANWVPKPGKESSPDKKAESLAETWKREIINVNAITAEAAEGFSPWDKAIEEANRKADLLLAKFEKVSGAKGVIESMRSALIGKADQSYSEAGLNSRGKMSDKQQAAFDDSAGLQKWAVMRADYRRTEEQAEFDHVNKMTGLQETLDQRKMLSQGNQGDALVAHFNFEQQRAELQLQWKLDHTALEESEITRIKDEHRQNRLVAEQNLAEQQAALWEAGAQKYINLSQTMTTMGVQMLLADESEKSQIGARMLATSVRFIGQGVQQYMFGKAKEHLLNAAAMAGAVKIKTVQAETEMGIGAAQATAWAAFYGAHSLSPYGGQAFIPAATAMTAAVAGFGVAAGAIAATGAGGVASELGMAAAWGAGGVAAGALGEAGASSIESGRSGNAAGYGAGTPSSPVVTQPTTAQQQGNVYIQIKMENVYGDQDQLSRWVEERLAPVMRDAGTRNIVFIPQ